MAEARSARLKPIWQGAVEPPALQERLRVVAETAADLRKLGSANFLYSDSDVLFAHAHRRHWDEAGVRFSAPCPPGLSLTNRRDLLFKGLHVALPDDDTQALYLASMPLTAEGWTPVPEGTVLGLRDGRELSRVARDECRDRQCLGQRQQRAAEEAQRTQQREHDRQCHWQRARAMLRHIGEERRDHEGDAADQVVEGAHHASFRGRQAQCAWQVSMKAR